MCDRATLLLETPLAAKNGTLTHTLEKLTIGTQFIKHLDYIEPDLIQTPGLRRLEGAPSLCDLGPVFELRFQF